MTQNGVPPGWSQDPTSPGVLRWWDGQRWTQQSTPGPAAAAQSGYPSFPAGAVTGGPLPTRTAAGLSKRKVAQIALVVLAIVGGFAAIAAFTGVGNEKGEAYQEGYQLGVDSAVGSVRTIGVSAQTACNALIMPKVGLTEMNSRRAKDMKRGCVQAVKDELPGNRPSR